MSSNKDQQFPERLSTAASARRAMLEKFQARRAVDDPAARERRAAQDALRTAREARAAEREAARRAKQEQLSAERLARKAAERKQRLAQEEQRRAQEAREAAERAEREAALERQRRAARGGGVESRSGEAAQGCAGGPALGHCPPRRGGMSRHTPVGG